MRRYYFQKPKDYLNKFKFKLNQCIKCCNMRNPIKLLIYSVIIGKK